MLVKLTADYDGHAPGSILEIEISMARRLISQGRAVLASSQEQMKQLKDEENKMVRTYDNKNIEPLRPKRKRGRPRKHS